MLKRALAFLSLLSAAGVAAATLPSCGEPNLNCITGHGGYATKYTLKPGTKQGSGTCDALKGEHVGLEKYNPAVVGDPMQQDLNRATLAMRTQQIGLVDDELLQLGSAPQVDLTHIDSQGAFTSVTPDVNDQCHIPTLTPASIDSPAFDIPPSSADPCSADNCEAACVADPANPGAQKCAQAAVNVTYTWSNVRVLTTNAYQGVIFRADLRYTDAAQGCSAEYDALGLYPAVSCAVKDKHGNVTGTDARLCNPAADPDAGIAAGSGINPDFQANVYCDPDVLLCLLKAPPAQLDK